MAALSPTSAKFADFASRHLKIRLDVTTSISKRLLPYHRAGEFDLVVMKASAASALGVRCCASFSIAMMPVFRFALPFG